MSDTRERLALLIDAENIGSEFAAPLMARARTLGNIVLARAYGNAKAERVIRWNALAREFGIECVDTPKNGKKNAADFELVIDAVEMLHTAKVDAFCIASGDGDFTSLAEKIKKRSRKLYVFAVGASLSSSYRVVAGENFFDVTELVNTPLGRKRTEVAATTLEPDKSPPTSGRAELALSGPELRARIKEALRAQNVEWAKVGVLANTLDSIGITMTRGRLKAILRTMQDEVELSTDERLVRLRP